MSIDKCIICDHYGKHVRLFGGYLVCLCDNHRMEWDEYFRDEHLDLLERVNEQEVRAAAAVHRGDGDTAAKFMSRINGIKDDGYKLSKMWVWRKRKEEQAKITKALK